MNTLKQCLYNKTFEIDTNSINTICIKFNYAYNGGNIIIYS
jgi:hypothetical protein